jgi:spore coat polysaccharide biosynthesis protein SpsF (cytidylyltransferase family)
MTIKSSKSRNLEEEIADYFHNESADFEQSEVDDYLTRNDDAEEGIFDNVSTEDLLDPDSPAPWNNI